MLLQLLHIEGQVLLVQTLLAKVIEIIFVCEILANHLLDFRFNIRFTFVLVAIGDLVIVHYRQNVTKC